jgi:hypothetical protein
MSNDNAQISEGIWRTRMVAENGDETGFGGEVG